MAERNPRRSTAARGAPAASSGFRGEEGRRRMLAEQERAAAQEEARRNRVYEPSRLRLSPGETREVIIVDEGPDFFRYEHNLKNPKSGHWDIFTGCVSEHANCPVCMESGKEPYFAMYLTVIDLTSYETRNGDPVDFSKRMMVVKPAQQKKIMRLFERHGTLRGMLVELVRDSDKDAQVGNDMEFVEFVPEEELETYVYTYTDSQQKEHEVVCSEVYDYDELFPEPTERALAAIVGTGAGFGSRDDADDDRGGRGGRSGARGGRGGAPRDNERGGGDGWPSGEGSSRTRAPRGAAPAETNDDPPARQARTRPARGAAAEDEPAPRSRAPAPAPRTATRAAARGGSAGGADAHDKPWQDEDSGSRAAPSAARSALRDRRNNR